MNRVMSIQSSVAHGHAGNSAAVFPMQRMGIDVIPVLTVHFSNHTGYGEWEGMVHSPQDVAAVVAGVEARGALENLDAILSGYLGTSAMAEVVLDAVERTRRHSPTALYCCDPVMGDVGRGVYVADGIPEKIRDVVVPRSTLLTPNHFELDLLTGAATTTIDGVVAAARSLIRRGPSHVIVTSARTDDGSDDTVAMVGVTDTEVWRVTTPRLPATFTGSGDLTSALLLGHLLRSGDLGGALSAAASSVYGILHATVGSSQSELRLVAAQDELVNPSERYEAIRLG